MKLLLLVICAVAAIICAVVCVLAYKRKRIRDKEITRRCKERMAAERAEIRKRIYCANCRHGMVFREESRGGNIHLSIDCDQESPCERFVRISIEGNQE